MIRLARVHFDRRFVTLIGFDWVCLHRADSRARFDAHAFYPFENIIYLVFFFIYIIRVRRIVFWRMTDGNSLGNGFGYFLILNGWPILLLRPIHSFKKRVFQNLLGSRSLGRVVGQHLLHQINCLGASCRNKRGQRSTHTLLKLESCRRVCYESIHLRWGCDFYGLDYNCQVQHLPLET